MENKKVSIQELVDLISSQADFTKKFTEEFIRELIQVVEEYLEKDGIVKVKGLGTFKLIWNEERKSVNVTTKQSIILPAHYKVTFSPEKMVKEAVNKPYEHLETTFVAEETIQETIFVEGSDNAIPSEEQVSVATKEVSSLPENEAPIQETRTSAPVQAPASNESTTPDTQEIRLEPTQESAKTAEEHNATASTPVKRRLNRLFLHLVIIIGLLVAVCAYFYYSHPSILNEIFETETIVEETAVPLEAAEQFSEVLQEEMTLEDEETDLFEDEDEYEDGEIINETDEIVEEDPQVYSPSIAQEAPVREIVTVIDGSRLTMVSYRAFGHKAFWVYVYDANRDVLSSSGDVEKGMKLNIPDLSDALVDPNSSECLTRAYALAKQQNYR